MRFSPAERTCSFCGLRGTDDTDFAGGLGAMMCEDCLIMYAGILATPENKRAARRTSWDDLDDETMLGKLPQILATADQVEWFLHEWVVLLRERGLSWTQIGKALGISRQAAWERFSRPREPE